MLAEPGGWDTDVRTPRLSGRLHSLEAGLESAWGSWGAGLAGDLAVGGFWLLLVPGGTAGSHQEVGRSGRGLLGTLPALHPSLLWGPYGWAFSALETELPSGYMCCFVLENLACWPRGPVPHSPLTLGICFLVRH